MKSRQKRPPSTGELIGVRLQPDWLERLDSYRRNFRAPPSRPQAVRSLLDTAFALADVGELLCNAELSQPEGRERAGVLIVTRDPMIAALQVLACEVAGCTVAGVARDTDQALRLADRTKFSIIISDTRLKTIEDGLEAVNLVCARHPAIAVFVTEQPEIFLTGDHPEPAYMLANTRHPTALKDLLLQIVSTGFSSENLSRSSGTAGTS